MADGRHLKKSKL